jgi:MoaA/NifB/PqqE/SkfB family radical SAM enzyme
MCAHKKMKRPKGYMDFSLFRKIIDECKGERVRLRLFHFGEPLLHPKLIEMIRFAKDNAVPFVDLNTNATLLDGSMATQIIRAGLDQIIFSVDGVRKETYERIRKNANFDRVRLNILNFKRIRDRLKLKKPRIVLQSMIMEDTKNELSEIQSFWGGCVDYILIGSVHTQAGQAPDYRIEKKPLFKDSERKPCRFLWQSLVIFYNGLVSVCCLDMEGMLLVGNLEETSIREIWRGERIKKLRSFHIEKKFSFLSLCRDCTHNA